MKPPPPRPIRQLVAEASLALGDTYDALAPKLRTSTRTISRWGAEQSTPSKTTLAELARLVHPVDAKLADEIARAAGTSLEGLGLAASGAPSDLPLLPSHVVDLLVCAGAEALAVSPQAMRPATEATIARMLELGLSPMDADRALRAAKKKPRG